MAVKNQIELLLALERGDYGAILGTAEGEEIDFKEGVYPLETPRQKWELAKDVGAFANARGGVIVIGYRTDRSETQLVDTAAEHRPVPKKLVKWESYWQTIERWLVPPPEGLTARWFPLAETEEYGVLTISLPPQPESMKYFVVREMARDDGSFPGAVGIPVRRGDAVTWLQPDAVHSLVREALLWRHQGPVLRGSEEDDPHHRARAQEQQVQKRCEVIESHLGWQDLPFLTLHAIPDRPCTRPDDFYAGTGIKGLLEEPGVLREAGFSIQTGADVEVLPDGSLVSAGFRRILWLSQDAFFSAASRADEEFLGWYFNQGREDDQPIALNPRVVAEYVLEFCRFVHRHLRPRSERQWTLWLSPVGFDRQGGVVLVPALAAGGQLAVMWRDLHYHVRKPLDPQARSIASGDSAGADAYRLMVELYSLFGEPPDQIPCVEKGEISETTFTT